MSAQRPQPWSPKKVATAYMDFTTGRGYLDNGTPIRPYVGRGRKNPNLTDKLDTIRHLAPATLDKVRILLTGKVPSADRNTRHWLLVQTPGWLAENHLIGTPPTGRFVHELTNLEVEVRVASEWFGDTPLNPRQARDAFMFLDYLLADSFKASLPAGTQTALMLSPTATAGNLWAATIPPGLNLEPVTEDIAEELHATSGQHHQEHNVSGPVTEAHPDVVPLIDSRVVNELPRFTYIDGRFMFAALCRELGTGPAVRLNRTQAYELMCTMPDAKPRARFEIRFTVPDTWRHVGIFGVQHPNAAQGWYYPNRPGATGITWADAAEVEVGMRNGWLIEPLQAIIFNTKMAKRHSKKDAGGRVIREQTAARPLDKWAEKLQQARQQAMHDPVVEDPVIRQAAGAALRQILLQGIGNFASRGRSGTCVVDDPKSIPPQYADTAMRKGEVWTYTVPQELSPRQQAFYRPELAVQVWGKGRARVLHAPTNHEFAGALQLPGDSIIGINGDAIYTTSYPSWALPQDTGGLDDGKAGRLRLKGYTEGPLPLPTTRAERDTLRARAEREGISLGPADIADQAAFPLEFDAPDDSPAAYQEGAE